MNEHQTNSSGTSDEKVGARRGLDVPIIDSVLSLSDEQIEAKVREAKDLFMELNGLEKPHLDEQGQNEESTLILVAKNVSHNLFTDKFQEIKANFLLDDKSNLYIREVASSCHGTLHGEVAMAIGTWRGRNRLEGFVLTKLDCGQTFGNSIVGPDLTICEILGSQLLPRCIIEVEVSHRSPRQSRELADFYFQRSDVKAVILLKVWGRRLDRTFLAVCVVWTKAQSGEIHCTEAHDFGTVQIDQLARTKLGDVDGPECRVAREYTVPEPGRRLEGRTPHVVDIPASLFLMNVTNQDGRPLNLPIDNLQLPLHRFARAIDRSLLVAG